MELPIPAVNVRIDDPPNGIQVVDCVGESLLGPDRFTNRLELDGTPVSPLISSLTEDA